MMNLFGRLGAMLGAQAQSQGPVFSAGDCIIDVSHHQGLIDWKKVKEDPQRVKAAIIKSSEGSSYTDRNFVKNVKGCIANGIPWSAYHFATWNDEDEVRDGRTEAQFFLKVIALSGHKPNLPLILDIESDKQIPYTKQEMIDYVKAFTDTVMAAGYKIGIYSGPGFLNMYLPTNHPFVNLPLWIADYTGAINPVVGWKKIWIHQYTDKGRVNGIGYNVDMNRVITP